MNRAIIHGRNKQTSTWHQFKASQCCRKSGSLPKETVLFLESKIQHGQSRRNKEVVREGWQSSLTTKEMNVVGMKVKKRSGKSCKVQDCCWRYGKNKGSGGYCSTGHLAAEELEGRLTLWVVVLAKTILAVYHQRTTRISEPAFTLFWSRNGHSSYFLPLCCQIEIMFRCTWNLNFMQFFSTTGKQQQQKTV